LLFNSTIMKKHVLLMLTMLISVLVFSQNEVLNETIDVQVCFTAEHTYVSDLGFYLIAPGQAEIEPGNYGVLQLLPAASDWGVNAEFGSWTGIPWSVLGCDAEEENTVCNSGNNLENFCFKSSLQAANPAYTACVCDMETPLTGEFASVEDWDSVYGFQIINSWGIKIYDCQDQDIGSLIEGKITFSNNFGLEIVYTLLPESPISINDGSCDVLSASYLVYSPDSFCTLDITIPNTVTQATDDFFGNCEFVDENVPFEPFESFDSIAIISISQISTTDFDVTYQIYQDGNTKSGIFSSIYNLGEEIPEFINLNLSLLWENTYSGAVQTISINHEISSNSTLFTTIPQTDKQYLSNIVYPNPVSDVLKFKDLPANTTVSIYDQHGRILVKDLLLENNEINVEQYESGIYTIKVEQNGYVKFSKFVKK